MPVRQYANAPATTLANSCSAVATSIVVTATTGLPISYPYTLIIDRGTATEEAVSVTAAAGTTLTVTRGIDSTTAFAHAALATVAHGITAQDIREANTHVNASTGVHGLAGAVVGTTDAQTVTNKTISADSNTLSGIAASSFVLSNGSGNIDGSAAQKAIPAGAVVGTTDAQTLTNKTLTAPAAIGSLAGLGEAWASWTPTINSGGTVGNAVRTGGWTQVGKIGTAWGRIVLGSTSSISAGPLTVSLPFTMKAASLTPAEVVLVDSGVTSYFVRGIVNGAALNIYVPGTNGVAIVVSSTVPFTWATNDEIVFAITGEVA